MIRIGINACFLKEDSQAFHAPDEITFSMGRLGNIMVLCKNGFE